MAQPAPIPSRSASHALRGRISNFSRSRREDDHELVSARRDLAALTIEQHVQNILRDAPPLTDEQAARIASLLRPAMPTRGNAPHDARAAADLQKDGITC